MYYTHREENAHQRHRKCKYVAKSREGVVAPAKKGEVEQMMLTRSYADTVSKLSPLSLTSSNKNLGKSITNALYNRPVADMAENIFSNAFCFHFSIKMNRSKTWKLKIQMR